MRLRRGSGHARDARLSRAGRRGFGVYANLGKVVFEPNEENPERVQIWGAFSVFAEGPNYHLRERGYLYYGVPLNEDVMKPPHSFNYARVDDVLLNPTTAPESIQIRGAFSLARTDGSFAPPQVGYLHMSLSRDLMVAGTEWLFRGSRGSSSATRISS